MSDGNGHREPATPSPGHECDELCGGRGKPCECPPCACPEHLARSARPRLEHPPVEDVAPRPGPPESLF